MATILPGLPSGASSRASASGISPVTTGSAALMSEMIAQARMAGWWHGGDGPSWVALAPVRGEDKQVLGYLLAGRPVDREAEERLRLRAQQDLELLYLVPPGRLAGQDDQIAQRVD